MTVLNQIFKIESFANEHVIIGDSDTRMTIRKHAYNCMYIRSGKQRSMQQYFSAKCNQKLYVDIIQDFLFVIVLENDYKGETYINSGQYFFVHLYVVVCARFNNYKKNAVHKT